MISESVTMAFRRGTTICGKAKDCKHCSSVSIKYIWDRHVHGPVSGSLGETWLSMSGGIVKDWVFHRDGSIIESFPKLLSCQT